MKNPLFNWLDHRASGVLLHPTSLPGDYGIGTLNDHCLKFIDFLAEGGFSYWQICPLGPTGYGNSPYQSFSAFAGNPYLISLRTLNAENLLDEAILEELSHLPQSFVDFGGLYMAKWPVLDAVYERFVHGGEKVRPYGSFTAFKKKHQDWLEPFAYYQALKEHYKGAPWYDWPEESISYEAAAKNGLRQELERQIDAQKFFQYPFYGQWDIVRQYANEKGVQIIGDLPIFVSLDSADVWQNQELFQIDPQTHQPTAVAGCPPDYFSENGQLWGNPLYDWEANKATGYDWWIKRLKASFDLYDVVRIDHFRGFESYWEIPFGAETAKTGKWVKGPGIDFFKAVKKKVKNCKLIAEDLGLITDEVRELRRDTGLPGMSILQFAFGGDADNYYLPHNTQHNAVLYPGTHDNDTSLGWYRNADKKTQDHVRRYYRIDGTEIGWDMIRSSYRSVARLSIIQLQDLMSLDSDSRFNTPGEAVGNWEWRYTPEQLQELTGSTAAYLKELGELNYRDGQSAVNTI